MSFDEMEEQWQGRVNELEAENAAMREIVECVAHASLDEMEQLIRSREWQDKAHAILEWLDKEQLTNGK